MLCAEEYCRDSFFGLILPDDVFSASPTVLSQLDAVRQKHGGSVLSLEVVPRSETYRYGIVDAEETEPGVYRIKGLVEKPGSCLRSLKPCNNGALYLASYLELHLMSCSKDNDR